MYTQFRLAQNSTCAGPYGITTEQVGEYLTLKSNLKLRVLCKKKAVC